jgi:hypothetical protein
VVKDLKLKHQFIGVREDGTPIYDHAKELPIVKFVGRVKLHGTNAAIVMNQDGSFYCQSRENVITPEKDNAGFAAWAHKTASTLPTPYDQARLDECGMSNLKAIGVYFGEWCGGSIQAGVALNQLPKMFVIFGLKSISGDESTWVDPSWMVDQPEIGIYTTNRSPLYEVEVDLNRPDKAIEIMNKLVEEIDKECPFAKTFGVSGHGEGIVFRPEGDNSFAFAFKVKGESHSKSKIKKLPTVDVEKMDSIQKAVDTYLHEDRLEQGYAVVVKSPEDESPTKIGEFIGWVVRDVIAEEGDALEASGISNKDFGSVASKVAARWFQTKLQRTV